MLITLTYRIETPGSVEAMANKIASDQSTGTFVAVPGETEELKARVAARVLAIRPLEASFSPTWPEAEPGKRLNRADVDIAFPLDAIGTDLAALMTIAIGGVFSIKGMTGIRIVDMKLPEAFKAAHPGPQFGIDGSRRLTGVEGRPIIGTIVKPALGLRPHDRQQPFVLPRLLHEVARASAHGFHGDVDRSPRRQHHDRQRARAQPVRGKA